MNFLENIFARLEREANGVVMQEVRDGKFVPATGAELLGLVAQARRFLAGRGLKRGERLAVVAPNSIRWVALDLAAMAEGVIVVPLYTRQAPGELAGMLRDSTPAAVVCSDEALEVEIRKQWPDAPEFMAMEGVFAGEAGAASGASASFHLDEAAPLAIIYTSGTSGEAKGVVLTGANVNHMLSCTAGRLDRLMEGQRKPEKVFHYTPFCFAASWIAMLTFLSRESVVTLSTDLAKLSDELKLAAPDYFLNVPALLERVRAKVSESIEKRGGFAAGIFTRAQKAALAEDHGASSLLDQVCLAMANKLMFPKIRKTIGPNLKALICGSAPLAVETQRFFMMLGIPVLQVYGLTETTAICTMDDPHHFEPGRVGRAIPGIEMKISEQGEILVRGPNVFAGYWQRPAETEKALEGGWFRTGDQGDVNANGNWRITGRLKNLIILNSGHNVAPEPIEQSLQARLQEAQQVVLVGNQRGFLTALVTPAAADGLTPGRAQSEIDALNASLPHYKKIRGFHIVPEQFSIENGLLTANGKLKRDAIAARFSAEIERLYQKQPA